MCVVSGLLPNVFSILQDAEVDGGIPGHPNEKRNESDTVSQDSIEFDGDESMTASEPSEDVPERLLSGECASGTEDVITPQDIVSDKQRAQQLQVPGVRRDGGAQIKLTSTHWKFACILQIGGKIMYQSAKGEFIGPQHSNLYVIFCTTNNCGIVSEPRMFTKGNWREKV